MREGVHNEIKEREQPEEHTENRAAPPSAAHLQVVLLHSAHPLCALLSSHFCTGLWRKVRRICRSEQWVWVLPGLKGAVQLSTLAQEIGAGANKWLGAGARVFGVGAQCDQ